MRSLLIVCLVVCVALVAGNVNAAGQISDNTLAQMGLANLQPMSDVQGAEVRGKGFVIAPAIAFAPGFGGFAASGALAVGRYQAEASATAAIGIGSARILNIGCCSIGSAQINCGVIAIATSSACAY